MENEQVSIIRCSSYDDSVQGVKSCLANLGGIETFVKPGQRVLLKVNLLYGKDPKYAVTTHPRIVEAVIEEVRRAGGIPSVGDSPAIFSLENAAGPAGIKELCEQTNTLLVELNDPQALKFPEGRRIKSFNISSKLKDFDVIINLPKMKTHVLCGMTLGVKNLYGCISGKQKGKYHLHFQDAVTFADMLLDLHQVVKPTLTLLDAVVAMEGQGPGSGEPLQVGLILASRNTIALDVVASKIAGFCEKDYPLIALAKKRKLIGSDFNTLEILGTPLSAIEQRPFKRARKEKSLLWFVPFKKQISHSLIAKPVLKENDCIKCKRCHEISPAGAIEITAIGPIFDYDKCIRCYCCHEICPKKAIELHQGQLARWLDKIK